MASVANLPSAPKLGLVQIANADASNQKSVLTAGAGGAKVTAVFALSDDSNARLITLSVLRGGVNYPISTTSVAANSGTDGTASSVDLLASVRSPWAPVDNDGQKYLLLEASDVLQVKSGSTVTSAKAVTVGAVGANF
jgi:hypothetical protein